MSTDPRLKIITETLRRPVSHMAPADLISGATLSRFDPSVPVGDKPKPWTMEVSILAWRIHTALYGQPKDADDRSPLAQAEDAKRRRDIFGEVAALTDGYDQLTGAPWHPARPGDLVHVHVEATALLPAYGETYLVGDAGDSLMSLQLLTHTFEGGDPDAYGVGCFVSEASDEPLVEVWMEAGPQRLTIVRDGQVVHDGGRRGRAKAATRILSEAETHAATMREVKRYLERHEPELASARLQSGKPLPPCGAPGFTPEQQGCARPKGHAGACSDNPDYREPAHECPALPTELYAVLAVGPKRSTVSFEGLYVEKDAALDAASGWDQHLEAERRGQGDIPDYVFVDLPAPGGPSVAVIAPMPVLPDPREADWQAESAGDIEDVDYADYDDE